MDKELAAIALITAVHLVAFAVLVWAMLDGRPVDWRGWWPGDEPDDAPPRDPAPSRDGERPLPVAAPAPVRLREDGRLADAYRRPRRPEHAPAPSREREPV